MLLPLAQGAQHLRLLVAKPYFSFRGEDGANRLSESSFEEGVGINLLTSADPGPPQGGAVYHDTSVWLRPA